MQARRFVETASIELGSPRETPVPRNESSIHFRLGTAQKKDTCTSTAVDVSETRKETEKLRSPPRISSNLLVPQL
jgi:hypothetical protein